MSNARQSVVEIRLVVLVTVNVKHPDFLAALRAEVAASAATVVAAEVSSNLESVPYVDTVSVHQA